MNRKITISRGGIVLAVLATTVSLSAATGHADSSTIHMGRTFPSKEVATTGRLLPGQQLKPNQSVRSGNGRYLLIQQGDGNLVLLDDAKKVLWNSRTGRSTEPDAVTTMQTDGNLVVRHNGKAVWNTETGGQTGAWLAVQNDGNLVLYSKDNEPLWTRFMSVGALRPGYSLKPNQSVRSPNGQYLLTQQGDGNLVLLDDAKKVLWNSRTGRSTEPDAVTTMQTDGNLVVRHNGKAVWNTETGGQAGAWLAVQNDGNLVLYSKDNKPLWHR